MTALPLPGTRFRLIIRTHPKLMAMGSLYAVESTPSSRPRYQFGVSILQELPRLEPGGVVSVETDTEKPKRMVVRADGVDMRLFSLKDGDKGPLYGEEGTVIAHPASVGWDDSSKQVQSRSGDAPDVWKKRMTRRMIGAGAASVAIFAFSIRTWASTGRTAGMLGTFMLALIAVLSYKAVRASRIATTASLKEPAKMMMRLWWSVGGHEGPQAIASLRHSTDPQPIAHVPVINVPAGFDPPGEIEVGVHGDPTKAPRIQCQGFELWPARTARRRMMGSSGLLR